MADANTEFLDALIRHQVFLLRFSGALRERLLRLLDATEKDIEAAILRRLAKARGFDTQAASRLRVLQRVIKRARAPAFKRMTEAWFEELTELAKLEPVFTSMALRTVSPVLIDTVLPAAEQLRALVRSRPFHGRTMRQWARKVEADDLSRILTQVQVGMVQGEPAAQIARRVVGTVRMKGVDGATEVTRREAAAITRTAVNHISNEARLAFFEENADVFDEELFVATLDSRTTPVCRANDGKRFRVGVGPRPPLHFGCRSLRVALIDGEPLGLRPQKPVTEQMLVREYAERNGLKRKLSRRESLPHGHKQTFDSYARRRVRDLTGTVPSKVNYQEWLGRQSAAFQDDVLGKTRGALFRRGGLRLDQFVNREGDQIPLSDLVRRHREAFRAAGLSPENF